MVALINRRTLTIEWGQCDPAGIVFYPQFQVIFDTSTGLLFARTGLSPSEMRKAYGILGLPLVELGTKFFAPCRFDDEVIVESAEICPNCRSSGAVTRDAIVSGLAPGNCVVT